MPAKLRAARTNRDAIKKTSNVVENVWRGVPLLMFTTHAFSNLEQEAALAGVSRVVSKSEGAPAIIRNIQELLDFNAAA